MFVDATYEGDLLAARASYHVGREDNAVYGETINGYFIADKHQFRFPVDPYRIPGAASVVLPGISAEPPRRQGSGDSWVQAYNFRMWLTTAEEGRPYPKPAGYNRDTYLLLERYLTSAPPGFDWDFTYRHGPIKLNLAIATTQGRLDGLHRRQQRLA